MKKLMRTGALVVVLILLLSTEAMATFALTDGISGKDSLLLTNVVTLDDPDTSTTTGGGTDTGDSENTDNNTGGNEEKPPETGGTVTPPPSVPEKVAPPIQLVISNAPPTIAIGDSATISYVLSNAPAGTQIIWSSNNPAAVSVDGVGTITGIKPGTAIITAATGDVSASCTVTATELEAESIEIAVKEFNATDKLVSTHEIKVGDILHLSISAKPKDAATPNVSWRVSDEEIASVSQKGELEALKKGKFTVTALGGEDDQYKATMDFEVTDGGFSKKYILLLGIALLLAAVTATIITILMRRGKKSNKKPPKRGGDGGSRSPKGSGRRDVRHDNRYDDDYEDRYEKEDRYDERYQDIEDEEESEAERIRREAYMRGYRDREEEDLTRRSAAWMEERDRGTKIYTGLMDEDEVLPSRSSRNRDFENRPFTFDDFDSD
ncbi:MAG: Ig-like domain-containing protein [Clostridiales Family XIII bacterium]|jgi:hypothetical protein|nr:Ig-like domain-containing protein [Clostridiales Family XIII bacterium]